MIKGNKELNTSNSFLYSLLPRSLVGVLVLLSACSQDPSGAITREDPFAGVGADFIQLDYESALTRGGVRRAWVDADSAWGWVDSTTVLLFGMEMTLYNEGGAESARVTSATGHLDTETQELIGRGDVVLNVFGERTTLQSEHLTYNPETGKIVSDTVTRAIIRGEQLDGTCFEADTEMTDIRICSPVGYFPPLQTDSGGVLPIGAPDRTLGGARGGERGRE